MFELSALVIKGCFFEQIDWFHESGAAIENWMAGLSIGPESQGETHSLNADNVVKGVLIFCFVLPS